MPPGVPPLGLFTTLARVPRVWDRFRAGSLLDRGPISLRHREIIIDRTCARCGCAYEWGVHGCVRLSDELHDSAHISEELWHALAAAFSSDQILELIALAGFYHTVSFFANGLRLPLEPYAVFPPEMGVH
jgi:alkylhydroperoxidase family enzyme